MLVRASSAPGKVILSGEYAVLHGAPAIAMAVDRRARVAAGDSAAAQPEGCDRALLDAICRVMGIDVPTPVPTQDTSSFFSPQSNSAVPQKLGIGSSAALSVALCKSLLPAGTTRMRLQQIATQAHRDFQQGAGSGADIAASVHGGVIQYEMHDQKAVQKNWPAGLYCQLFWSGVPASTTARLARLQAGQRKDSYRRLQDAAVAVAGAWSGPGPGPLLESFSHYVSALQAFDVDHELGIFDAGHDRLVRQAPDHQLVYKPCGAGGGDLGIALGTDPVRLSEFAAVATDNGFVALDLTLDLQGVAFCEDPQ